MQDAIGTIKQHRVVPVVVVDSPDAALRVCEALLEGGLPVAEITFRTAAAVESIRAVTKQMPEILVGAGTVLSVSQAEAAVDAGASFIVSPGFSPTLVSHCLARQISVMPGCCTPTDLTMAVEHGLETVKFFPAETAGGLPALEAMAAPFTQLRFVPLGGIDASNMRSYLAFPKVAACGGSWMVHKDLVSEGRFDRIRDLTAEAVAIAAEAAG